MGTRGPKPASLANVSTLDVAVMRRPQVPRKLRPFAAAVWRETVGAKPADFFEPSDIPLLTRYCTLLGMAEEAEDMLYTPAPEGLPGDPAHDPLVRKVQNGYPVASPHISIIQTCTALAASLSVKLRLNANARETAKAPKKAKAGSGRAGLLYEE